MIHDIKHIQKVNNDLFHSYFCYYMEFFLEFIEVFKDISYQGIPFPLLVRFERYVDENLYNYIIDNSQKTNLELGLIQPKFNNIVEKVKENNFIKSNNSKEKKLFIYNSSVLRFPDNIFSEYFDPEKTVILARQRDYKGVPVDYLKKLPWKIDERKVKKRLKHKNILTKLYVKRAKKLFSSFSNHPLFNNPFFKNKFIADIPIILEQLITIENYFRNIPMSCILIAQTGDLDERIIAIIAAIKGIPCICTQHGLIMGKLDTCYFPVFASKQAVYGEFEKEYYSQLGVIESNIEITGHPRFDVIQSKEKMSRSNFINKIGTDASNKLVLIITSPMYDFKIVPNLNPSYYWNSLIEKLTHNPNIQVIIKPSYFETRRKKLMKNYIELSLKYDRVKILDSKVHLYDVLPNVDVVAVESSTVGLEAMLFDIPVVSLAKDQFFWVNTYNYYYNLDCFIQSDPNKLANIINQLLSDKDLQKYAKEVREKFLQKAYINKNELSGKRLLNLINQLINQSTFEFSNNIANGSLISGSDEKVYIIDSGLKRYITSPQVFKRLGFERKNIKRIQDDIIKKIPTGNEIT